VLVSDNPTLALDAAGSSTPTVQKRRRGDAGLSENASESGTTIGESGQCRLPGASDGVKVPVDQSFDVRFRSGDGSENLAGAGFRFDIADAYLEMPLPFLATPDEGRIRGHHDRRRHYFRPPRGALTEYLAGFQGVTPQRLGMLRGVNRKHPRQ
jgi:hypothetical protein